MSATTERLQVNMRLERDLIDDLDDLARESSLDRAELARRLLRDGLRHERLELALRQYRRGEVSIGRAAEIARVSLYEIIDQVHDEGIPYALEASELEGLTQGARASGRVAAVRESPMPYGSSPSDSAGGIDYPRTRFRPDHVRWLFVGESSPAGGTHFYRADSNLFRATRAAFARVLGAEVPDGPAFLHWFRAWGGWLVDLADHPVNRLDPTARSTAVAAGVGRLTQTIRDTRPRVIVCVKASIATQVRAAAAQAGFAGTIVVLPFPVRKWTASYVDGLSTALAQATPRDHASHR
jgi:predicted HTH domain antitoxin